MRLNDKCFNSFLCHVTFPPSHTFTTPSLSGEEAPLPTGQSSVTRRKAKAAPKAKTTPTTRQEEPKKPEDLKSELRSPTLIYLVLIFVCQFQHGLLDIFWNVSS